MPRVVQSLSRTSSTTSVDSSSSSVIADAESIRRTRKRFTNSQLVMLEQLFHRNSHPSRDEREAVARTGDMELKSVTIWFQNKRQNVKLAAAKTSSSDSSLQSLSSYSTGGGYTSAASYSNSNKPFRRASTVSSAFSSSSTSSRLSLDRVASMSELRFPKFPPRSPVSGRHQQHYHHHHRQHPAVKAGTIYDNMPSSPPVPPTSPDSVGVREFVEFGKLKRTRTLEWACARRRLATREGELTTDGEDTEVDEDNGLSPIGFGEDPDMTVKRRHVKLPPISPIEKTPEDQKMDNEDMLAAVALCRLGQGR